MLSVSFLVLHEACQHSKVCINLAPAEGLFYVQDKTHGLSCKRGPKACCYNFSSTSQLIIKKWPLVELWCSIKAHLRLPGKAIKVRPTLPTGDLGQAAFPSHTLTKTTACDRLRNKCENPAVFCEARCWIELQTCRTRTTFLTIFFFLDNIVSFHKSMLKYVGFIPVTFKWIKKNTFLSFSFQ